MTESTLREYVTFSSDLFSKAGKQHYINPCCFCEDLANWLRDGLQNVIPQASVDLYQEDFGWVIDIKPRDHTYTIMVVVANLDEEEQTDQFRIYFATRIRLFSIIRRFFSKSASSPEGYDKVILASDRALQLESRIRNIQWWREGFVVGSPASHPQDQG